MLTKGSNLSSRRAGQIKRRGERRWLVSIFVGRAENGKRIYRAKTVHGTQRDAERSLRRWLAERDAGTVATESTRITLDAYLARWLEAKRSSIRERTYQSYAYLLDRHVRPDLGAAPLNRIQPLMLQGLYARMQDKGRSAKVVRDVHVVLKAALAQAVRWRMLAVNPADGVNVPKRPTSRHRALSLDEVRRLRRACAKNPYGLLYVTMVVTGMRPGELLGLEWRNCDLEQGSLRVDRALVRLPKPDPQGRRWLLTDPKTPSSRRTVPIPPQLLRALKAHRARQMLQAHRARQAEGWQDYGLVFCGRRGQPLDWHNVSHRHFKQILKDAKLSNVRPYDLRHTCATLLAADGEGMKVVAERLGHSKPSLTLDVYTHVLPGMQERATAKLATAVYESA